MWGREFIQTRTLLASFDGNRPSTTSAKLGHRLGAAGGGAALVQQGEVACRRQGQEAEAVGDALIDVMGPVIGATGRDAVRPARRQRALEGGVHFAGDLAALEELDHPVEPLGMLDHAIIVRCGVIWNLTNYPQLTPKALDEAIRYYEEHRAEMDEEWRAEAEVA